MFWTNFYTYNTQAFPWAFFWGNLLSVYCLQALKNIHVYTGKNPENIWSFSPKIEDFFSKWEIFTLCWDSANLSSDKFLENLVFFSKWDFLLKLAEIQICWNQQIWVKIPILRKNSQFLEKKDKIFYAFLQFTVPCKFCPTYTLVKITGTTLYICICVPVLTGFS